jgi:hypothetical protein
MKEIGPKLVLVLALLGLAQARPAAAVSPACIQLFASVPGSSCPNCSIVISGNVKNCGLDPETIAIYVQGNFVLQQVAPAAASVVFSYPTVATCVNGGSASYAVVATGTTGIAPDAQDTQIVTVICAAPTPARPSTWGAIKSIYRA